MTYDVGNEELTMTTSPQIVTLVFSERTNSFICTRDYRPSVFMQLGNGVLSAGILTGADVYRHDWASGVVPQWYGANITATVTTVINKYPKVAKRAMAIDMEATAAPTKIDYSIYTLSTMGLTEVSTGNTFTSRRPFIYRATVPNQTSDDGRVRSNFLGAEITLSATTTSRQKIVSFLMKFLTADRNYRS
jgi:hypothetical protein